MPNSNTTKMYVSFGVTILLCIISLIEMIILQNHQDVLNERKIFIEQTKSSINDLIIRVTVMERKQ